MHDNTIEHLGLLEEAFRVVKLAEAVDKKVRARRQAQTIREPKALPCTSLHSPKAVITSDEHARSRARGTARRGHRRRRLLAGGGTLAQRAVCC